MTNPDEIEKKIFTDLQVIDLKTSFENFHLICIFMENKPDCTQRDACSIRSYAMIEDMDRS